MESDSGSHESAGAINRQRERLARQLSERVAAGARAQTVLRLGRVIRSRGETLQVTGMPAPTGARCLIERTDRTWASAEVVSFDADSLFVMPETGTRGIGRGARVQQLESEQSVPVGDELLGRVIDGEGSSLDGRPAPAADGRWPLLGVPLNPMARRPLEETMDCGVRVINAMTTLGRGMRMGVFAGSGVGKSTLLGMLARFATADVVVVALVGERGREVREFINDSLGPEALARAVVVAAPADTSPLSRVHAAHRASAIAEYFRAEGRDVLLLMDSLTRLAMAGREIGLATGEPPAMKGYPPSTFSLLSGFVERAGQGAPGQGSITAIYTVLVEGDDHVSDPVADTARAVLDGHIVLSRTIAESGIYPPVDIESSLSRVMKDLVPRHHNDAALHVRQLWSRLEQKSDLVDMGAYQPGADPTLDQALERRDDMERLIMQPSDEPIDMETSVYHLQSVLDRPADSDD